MKMLKKKTLVKFSLSIHVRESKEVDNKYSSFSTGIFLSAFNQRK